MKALVTGGCGFIGSHVVRALVEKGWQVTNLDALTYASNPWNLSDLAGSERYRLVNGDICDVPLVADLVRDADLVVNLAAESHVDRSLLDPAAFIRTDVEGVVCLLDALRQHPETAFVHMSTDEVFGSVPEPELAGEERTFAPTSPYSASKAAAELQIRAYATSYGMSVSVIRCCNVFGPNQHIEKFIPLFITRALAGLPLPLYGDGLQEREWLFVEDFVTAFERIISAIPATPGVHATHVGSGVRVTNREVARQICELLERPQSLIQPVEDRPGHDRRYGVDWSKLRTWGWSPQVTFEDGLTRTVAWYTEHRDIWKSGATPEFQDYLARQYGERLEAV